MAEGGPRRRHAGAGLAIGVVRHGDGWAEPAITDALIESAGCAAFGVVPEPPAVDCEATVLLTGDDEMRDLNRTWRQKDTSTNVLSFPSGSAEGFLGDIVLAHETVLAEAKASGIRLEDHVAHLVVHGVLHLLGFDHMNDVEAERMEALEREALASLGVADPYSELPLVEHAQ